MSWLQPVGPRGSHPEDRWPPVPGPSCRLLAVGPVTSPVGRLRVRGDGGTAQDRAGGGSRGRQSRGRGILSRHAGDATEPPQAQPPPDSGYEDKLLGSHSWVPEGKEGRGLCLRQRRATAPVSGLKSPLADTLGLMSPAWTLQWLSSRVHLGTRGAPRTHLASRPAQPAPSPGHRRLLPGLMQSPLPWSPPLPKSLHTQSHRDPSKHMNQILTPTAQNFHHFHKRKAKPSQGHRPPSSGTRLPALHPPTLQASSVKPTRASGPLHMSYRLADCSPPVCPEQAPSYPSGPAQMFPPPSGPPVFMHSPASHTSPLDSWEN